jgi:hypothetical protein
MAAEVPGSLALAGEPFHRVKARPAVQQALEAEGLA